MNWWLRRQTRLCQDYLADAFAADQSDVPEDYAEFLVAQTGKRMLRFNTAALGFSDRKSNLFRRVVMLLDDKQLDQHCYRRWNIAVSVLAAGVLLGLACVRLDAGAPPDGSTVQKAKLAAAEVDKSPAEQKQPRPAETADKPANDVKSVTYSGVVIDRVTEQPVSGATVIIERELSNPPEGMEDFKRTTRVESDEDGKYAFTLAPDEVAQKSLYIEVDAHHPDYAAKGRSGYAHSMIQKNLKLGEPPFYSRIRLWPGKPVTGRVLAPDGTPVEGVEILTFGKHRRAKWFNTGGFYETKTDMSGRFRFVAASPGEAVYWLDPKGFSPQAHFVTGNFGNVGDLVLEHGVELNGTVLDARRKPVSGVLVEARRNGDGETVDPVIRRIGVSGHIGRRATTDANGIFRLDELPEGTYQISVQSTKPGWLNEPLKDVFVRQSIKIVDGEQLGSLEIQAVSHVEIAVKFFDGEGKPTASNRFHVSGRVDGESYFTRSTKSDREAGLGVVRVPHGLTKTLINLYSTEHSVLRWRKKEGEPLHNSREIELGTLQDDSFDLEVVRLVAPILLVKAVDKDGMPLRDFKPKGVYEEGKSPKNPNSQFLNGVRGDVKFEEQPDGRWRSSQLQPDLKVTVVAEMEGRRTKEQIVSLKEAETRGLVFVMEEK